MEGRKYGMALLGASVIMLILRPCQDVRERPKEVVTIPLYVSHTIYACLDM